MSYLIINQDYTKSSETKFYKMFTFSTICFNTLNPENRTHEEKHFFDVQVYKHILPHYTEHTLTENMCRS